MEGRNEDVIEGSTGLTRDGFGLDLRGESQLDALGDAVFQVSGVQLVLEVVKKDGNERAGNHVHQTVIRANVLADEVVGGRESRRDDSRFHFVSVSLLGRKDLSVVIGAEFEGVSAEVDSGLGRGDKEVLTLADLGELQLEFSAVGIHAALCGTGGLFDGKSISRMNGLFRMGLVNEIKLNIPILLAQVESVALDNQLHEFSFDLVYANAFILSEWLPQATVTTSLLKNGNDEVRRDHNVLRSFNNGLFNDLSNRLNKFYGV